VLIRGGRVKDLRRALSRGARNAGFSGRGRAFAEPVEVRDQARQGRRGEVGRSALSCLGRGLRQGLSGNWRGSAGILRIYAEKRAHCEARSGGGSGVRIDAGDQVCELDDVGRQEVDRAVDLLPGNEEPGGEGRRG